MPLLTGNPAAPMWYWPTMTNGTTTNLTYSITLDTAQATTALNNLSIAMNVFTSTTATAITALTNYTNYVNHVAYPIVNAYTTFRTPEETAALARRRKRAAARAKKLLAEHLTDQEMAQLAASGYFEVTSLTSGRRYRIYRGHSRNIVELDAKGVAVARLCAYPGSPLPDEDHMLAQRLYLMSEEEAFRKVANFSKIGAVEADRLAA